MRAQDSAGDLGQGAHHISWAVPGEFINGWTV